MSDTQKIKGVVRKIYDRVHKGVKYYNIAVDIGEKDDVWYSMGANEPEFEEGVTVEFNAYQKGKYWNVKGPVTVVAKSTPAASSGGGGWNSPERQASIIAQSSFDKAIRIVELALDNEAFSLGSKPAARFDLLLEQITETAAQVAARVDTLSNRIANGELEEEDDFDPAAPPSDEDGYNPLED